MPQGRAPVDTAGLTVIGYGFVFRRPPASYVVNASKLHRQKQLSEQLRHALESPVIIEQAKGITAQQHTVPVCDDPGAGDHFACHDRLLALVCNFGETPLIDDLPLG
jgi:hypothetical protein